MTQRDKYVHFIYYSSAILFYVIITYLRALDCEQSLYKSVERIAVLRKSCFVTQTNEKSEGGLGLSSQASLGLLFVFDCLRKAGHSGLLRSLCGLFYYYVRDCSVQVKICSGNTHYIRTLMPPPSGGNH